MHENNKTGTIGLTPQILTRIYLIGFMGVGKSTLGKKLARELDFQFVDLDDLFEKKYKIRIDDFFGKYDEDLFRTLEYETLNETFSMNKVVIATGGGTPCFFETMKKINKRGVSIHLKMSSAAIASRLHHAKKPRPLIKDKTGEELCTMIKQKLNERIHFYEQAHFTVDAISVDVKEVVEMLNRNPKYL